MIDELIQKIKEYNPTTDEELIRKAYELAFEAHKDQKRNSGEPYIIHPVQVAMILADLNMDDATIAAGLMHDVLEDTPWTHDEMEAIFGEEITNLVEGVTKLKNLNYKSAQESQAENIRKMVMAMSKDIRVIIIKLADRLHNMRTLEYMTPEKKIRIATETIEIYVPLAHRLGIYAIKWELEDLCLRYLHPEAYYDLAHKIDKKRVEREHEIERISQELKAKMAEFKINGDVTGRPKSIYSIWKKMTTQQKTFDQIFDLTALRVIVDTVKDCYGVLGIVHTLWKPIPGRFKDYIAMPKHNMYQSLHTTVLNSTGDTFEVQIRTWEMHKTAEYGIAAHWKYKEGRNKSNNFDEKLNWLRQLMEWQKDLSDSKEFMETLKGDFFSDEVYVFSPKGDVVNLPIGSTPVDFAYRVHSAVGNHCVGAKVDGKIVPLSYELKTGNIVEILTASNSPGPSRDWLNIVKSNQARTKIKQWFKREDRDINLIRGREAVEREVRKRGYPYSEILKDEWLMEIANRYASNSIDDLFVNVGYGTVSTRQVVNRLEDYYKNYYKTNKPKVEPVDFEVIRRHSPEGIWVKGVDNIKIKLARCCNPLPGDEIVGYITRGSGVSVHRKDCTNISNVDPARFLEVHWDNEAHDKYETSIDILAFDLTGVLAELTTTFNDAKVPILGIRARANKDRTVSIEFNVTVKSKEFMNSLIKDLKAVNGVLEVKRSK